MAASIDRAAFFAAVRKAPFGGNLTVGQVSGMESILDACPVDLGTDSLAYCFATALHETARTMLPIKEYGGASYFHKMYDKDGSRPQVAKALGNTVAGDGVKFAGRGYVQLTGRSNYRRATGELQARGYLTNSQDLTQTPDMAMTPDVAAAILFIGMIEGWFTGKKLSHYFGNGKLADPVNARRIINGTDKAEMIAGYWRLFQSALVVSGHKPGAVAPRVPTPPVETKSIAAEMIEQIPVPKPVPTAANDAAQPKPSLGSRLMNWLSKPFFG